MIEVIRHTPQGSISYMVVMQEGKGVVVSNSTSLVFKDSKRVFIPSKGIPTPVSGKVSVFKHNPYAYHKQLLQYKRQTLHRGGTHKVSVDMLANYHELYLDTLDCIDTI